MFRRFVLGVFVFLLLPALPAQSAAPSSKPNAEELSLGDAVHSQFQAKGELLGSGPEVAMLKPIFARLAPVAKARYGQEIRFYVHRSAKDDGPNAYASFGPNLYVETALVHFALDREQISGVLCHEISHALHHDLYRDLAYQETNELRYAKILRKAKQILKGHFEPRLRSADNFLATVASMHHSRVEEEQADLTGADICAEAGINPWGLVWMFRRFQHGGYNSGVPIWLADHPNFAARIHKVAAHLKRYRRRFSKWKDDESGLATPLQ